MQVCKSCGRIRPDSQSLCDCATPAPASDREPFPIATGVSIATAFAIVAALVTMESWDFGDKSWNGVTAVLALLLVAGGTVVSGIAGFVAYRRGEPRGGRLAAFGIAIMIAMLLWVRAR